MFKTGNTRRFRVPMAAIVAVVAVLGAASAHAAITIYSNSFKSTAALSEIRRIDAGDKCKTSIVKGHLQVKVVANTTRCRFEPPVEGDSEIPNHDAQIAAKVFKGSSSPAVRKAAFVSIALRATREVGYELRVFPRTGRYRLVRSPASAEFPLKGTSEDIRGIGERNLLRLRAIGASVSAFVNGTRIAEADDSNPGQVKGKRINFGLSSNKNLKSGPTASFDQLAIKVPAP